MNDSQVAAIETALRRTLTLIQGPPGTGKTRTLGRLVAAATHVMPRGQILAAAASNVAVDNLVTQLVGLGIKVVRVGQPVKASPGISGINSGLVDQGWNPTVSAALYS